MKIAYIDFLLYGNSYTLLNHSAEINDIASKCKLYYGQAVDDAKSLQKLLNIGDPLLDNNCEFYSNNRGRTEFSNDKADQLSITPNPAISTISVTNNLPILSYKIAKSDGSLILDMNCNLCSEVTTIDVSNFKNGIYFISVNGIGGLITTKSFIISK